MSVDDLIIARAGQIRLLVLDVDGVLTDGRLILGPNGEEYKAFHVRDGHGLVMLRNDGVDVAIITGRKSTVVERRMAELGIVEVHQGIKDKAACLLDLLARRSIAAANVCYVGDDVPDCAAMRLVGLPVAVADASSEAASTAQLVTRRAGGNGAVREVCDLILGAREGQMAVQ